jgi:anionic cell wall polymer biosynthesis LytR-Cps2A-Psr (LCP) family protein
VIALDLEGIQAANEAVGGVTVKSLIDYESPDHSIVLREGENVELHGKALEQYIRTRSHYSLDANAARMARQKQYVTEFSKIVVKKSKQNLTFPVEIFSSLSDYMVTDLSLPDVTFLSTCFLENGANFTFRTIDGTYERSGVSAVFYPDDVDLFEAVLQVFYLQID